MYDQITMPNGLRIIAERIPHFRSVSIGLWVKSGSLYETEPENGVSHFIEHMLFKGTERRTARQIAEEMDAVGGSMNAFTSKECTCFYAKVVDEHLPMAMDLIADIVRNSLFTESDIAREKGVVLEEIGMAEDQPEDLVSELLMEARLDGQALARPILGPAEGLKALTREQILDYYARMYRPENCVLSVAGNYEWDKLLAMAEQAYGTWQGTGAPEPSCETVMPPAKVVRREKDIEQIHICLSWPGVAQGTREVFPVSILNTVFGGAMSSRLFQRIREESGMAYSVYSYPASYPDVGMLSVYAGASIDNAPEVLRMIREEVDDLRENGLTMEEFLPAREQLKGSYILGLETTGSRMNSIGRRKLLLNETQTESEVIEKLNAITLDEVNALARRLFSADCAVSLVGDGADTLDVSMFCTNG